MDDSFGLDPNQQQPSNQPDHQQPPGSPFVHHSFQPPHPDNQSFVAPQPIEPVQTWPSSPPSQPALPTYNDAPSGVQPTPVVKVLSTRGVEYAMMTFALWFAADALIAILLLLVNGGSNFAALAFPISVLIVTLPVFSWLFLRLKKAELLKPSLRLDPSKRRFSQITQVFTFLVSLLAIISLVYSTVAKIGGSYSGSYFKTLADIVIVLVVAGGLFWYYWVDEHKHQLS